MKNQILICGLVVLFCLVSFSAAFGADIEAKKPGLQLTEIFQFTLNNVFNNSLRAIVSILETYDNEDEIREAFAGFWSYQRHC